jgi:hypothetical protein
MHCKQIAFPTHGMEQSLRTVICRALGVDSESFPLIVLIIPRSKLNGIRFEARRARKGQSLSKKDLESMYGKASGVASALDDALPFVSDLLSLIVNVTGQVQNVHSLPQASCKAQF